MTRQHRPRRTLPPDSEAMFQARIVQLAGACGWMVYHAPAGGKDGQVDREQVGAGFPDLVLVRDFELIFAELKTETGRVRPAQIEWMQALARIRDRFTIAAGLAEHPDVPGHLHARFPELEPHWPALPRMDVKLWRPSDWDDIVTRLNRGGLHRPPPAVGPAFDLPTPDEE